MIDFDQEKQREDASIRALKDPMGAFYIGGCLGMRTLNSREPSTDA